MSNNMQDIKHEKIEDMLVAYIAARGTFEDSPPKWMSRFNVLRESCEGLICGSAMALYDYGVYTKGVHVDLCYPVTERVESDDIKSKIIEGVEVLSLTHYGLYEKMGETYKKLYSFMREHEVVPTAYGREVYLEYHADEPERNATELQAVLHKWETRFARHVERVLGLKAREAVMKDSDLLYTIESTAHDKAKWLKAAMETLDGLTDEEQKFEILSCCAHEFSDRRTAKLRAVYKEAGNIEAVIKFMHEDPDWYDWKRAYRRRSATAELVGTDSTGKVYWVNQ
ncbi:hypothetical protein AMJ83_05755 [candidate division WOR_3 bacterium SM23_42]|uniref:AraC effector-binding domain-containing protein n=1 Tax=candidate division WOR_3 bacterium SM23_42 TaxID=1703779 RepID=A0A0S8FSH3_UNCW3|nr:MAG: hypothetical protein AMJ83_05755 [candidate division WOR_3 bacterium SM23_42]